MRKAQRRLEVLEYGERHHIFPKSIFGENKTIVKLTYREHFIAHKLLLKICEKRYGVHHPYTAKMSMAYHRMVYTVKDRKVLKKLTSFDYSLARTACSNAKRGKSNAKAWVTRKLREQGLIPPKKTPQKRKSLEEWYEIAIQRNGTTKASEFYKNMTDAEFETWLKTHSLRVTDKNGKTRPNANVTRALVARKIPLCRYYKAEDYNKNWFDVKIHQVIFYGIVL